MLRLLAVHLGMADGNSEEYINIRDANRDWVQEKNRDHKEPINTTGTMFSQGQVCNSHVLTVGMRYWASHMSSGKRVGRR